MTTKRFSYAPAPRFPGMAGLPFVPLTLTSESHILTHEALVDSGSSINVLPYHLGVKLGLSWETQTFPLDMIAGLAGAPAFGVMLTGQVDDFPPVLLAFAWTQKTDVRLILGQTNFFQLFKVTFDGQAKSFELKMNS